ncbi:hypothetical protein KJ966_05215 [bacterium]|nr:hypothetical protein [bacterium]
MDKLDKLLRAAKPSVPDLPEGFSRSVMNQIEQEKLVIRAVPAAAHSRLFFIIGFFALVASLLLFNYNSYELRMNGSLELLFFGLKFFGDFISLLPWDLIVPSLALSTLSAWMLWKSGFLKIGITGLTIVSFLFTGIGGTAIAATGFNEQIEAGIIEREGQMPWLTLFHNTRAREFIHHPNFKMGKVETVINGKALIVTPHGDKISIQIPSSSQVKVGQVLRLSGEGSATEFIAQNVHICNPNRVNRYFNHMAHHEKMMKSCCMGKGKK